MEANINIYSPSQGANQLVKKGYSNEYFENDSDEYDNIDCDFLLAVLGEDQNSRKSSVPFNSNVSVTSDLSSQHTSVKMERTRQSFEQNSFEINKQDPIQYIKAKTLSKTPSLPKSASSRSIQLEASKDRRRERNKILARKTRCKKKEEFETLRRHLLKLRNENDRLSLLVKGPPPIKEEALFDGDMQLPDNVLKTIQYMTSSIEASTIVLTPRINPCQRSFCITNTNANDNPIVFASPGFMMLTGYDIHDILGHNCRFLQGVDTDKGEVHKLTVAVREGREEQVVIKNYRRDGSGFWNRLHIAPIRDEAGKVNLIVSVQYEVPSPCSQMESIPMPINIPMSISELMPINTPMPIKRELHNTLLYTSAPSNGYSSNGSTDNAGSGWSGPSNGYSFNGSSNGSSNGSTDNSGSGGSGPSSCNGYSSNGSTDGLSF